MDQQPLGLPRLAPRSADSHKGDYGRALLIGGSRGMTGAIALAGRATLRSGAGLVTLAVPAVCQDVVANQDPCYMTVPLPCDDQGRVRREAGAKLFELLEGATAGACGPGWGRSDDLTVLVRELYTSVRIPLVVDADGLNGLATGTHGLSQPGGGRVLTPHPGEFDRLWGDRAADPELRCRRAVEMAGRSGVVIVLKGHRTLITDGQRTARNETGNPGMATGGSGDVLTGVITALLCQGLSPWEAARLGVYVHGLAGDHTARRFSQVAMTALDLIDCLPDAWKTLQS